MIKIYSTLDGLYSGKSSYVREARNGSLYKRKWLQEQRKSLQSLLYSSSVASLANLDIELTKKLKSSDTTTDLIEDLIVRDSIKGQIEELKNKVNIREAKQFKKYSPEDNHVEDIKPIVEKVEAPKKELSGLSKIKRS